MSGLIRLCEPYRGNLPVQVGPRKNHVMDMFYLPTTVPVSFTTELLYTNILDFMIPSR